MSAFHPTANEAALLSPAQFARISEIARREAGLALSAAKTSMISARIARRLRDTGQPISPPMSPSSKAARARTNCACSSAR
jgi:hypothetical protein